MKITARRHWVTTLLAVWMFADAAQMLLWTMSELYMRLWGFHHRPPNQPLGPNAGMNAGMWVLAIWYSLRLLLSLLPVPHLLQHLDQIPWLSGEARMILNHVALWVDLAVTGIAVALGYGLLRMREWARWSYAALCVFTVVFFAGLK